MPQGTARSEAPTGFPARRNTGVVPVPPVRSALGAEMSERTTDSRGLHGAADDLEGKASAGFVSIRRKAIVAFAVTSMCLAVLVIYRVRAEASGSIEVALDIAIDWMAPAVFALGALALAGTRAGRSAIQEVTSNLQSAALIKSLVASGINVVGTENLTQMIEISDGGKDHDWHQYFDGSTQVFVVARFGEHVVNAMSRDVLDFVKEGGVFTVILPTPRSANSTSCQRSDTDSVARRDGTETVLRNLAIECEGMLGEIELALVDSPINWFAVVGVNTGGMLSPYEHGLFDESKRLPVFTFTESSDKDKLQNIVVDIRSLLRATAGPVEVLNRS